MPSLELHYMKVRQRDQVFFLSKCNALELKKVVDFHFREPYSDLNRYSRQDFESLKKNLTERDLQIDENPHGGGIQRALNPPRVYEIRDYVESDPTVVLPTAVLLAIDTSQSKTEVPELGETGVFRIEEDMNASVIDGQHRLAGLFLADEEVVAGIEIPIVFMLDIDIPTAARLFQQINGKQRQVNRSVLYDLFEGVPDDALTNADDRATKQYHTICKTLYSDRKSPLFRQIKMLGTGGGAISQACFIETCKKHLAFMADWGLENRYEVLFGYLSLLQRLFPDDWPVPQDAENLSFEQLDSWAHHVLKERKSQMMKTNGFVALIMLLRWLYEKELSLSVVELLVGEIDWTNIVGTGANAQSALYSRLRQIIERKEPGRAKEDEKKRKTIAELIDIICPNIGTDIGNDDFVYGNYCEWPDLESLDKETLEAAGSAIGLPANGDMSKDDLVAALREWGMPEGTVYEDAGEMRLYPDECLYWRDERGE